MGLLTFASGIYNLDTLDTRFTSSSSAPYRTVIDSRSDPNGDGEGNWKVKSRSKPSKWKTPEFSFYILVVALVIPYIFWVCYDVSRRTL